MKPKKKSNFAIQKITILERQCCANTQYSGRGCMEINGIFKNAQRNKLKETARKIFHRVWVAMFH